jgi:hypothetical protein
MRRLLYLTMAILILSLSATSQIADKASDPSALTIARFRYGGGADWYWGRSALPNLHKFLSENTNIKTVDKEANLQATDPQLLNYPFLYMTGHGNMKFTDQEVSALREYLTSGGFLFANDSYGLAPAFRREMKRVFPEKELVELPFNHPIYHQPFEFANGLPKIHEHDGKPPQGFGIFWENRLVVFFDYESDIGDGLEDAEVYNDPPEKHQSALKMAANIVTYAMTH